MTARRTMSYAGALACAVSLALAGCTGGKDEPTATPTATGSPSVTASGSGSRSPSASGTPSGSATPSSSATVAVPSAARAHTEAGAVEFAKFYITEADRAYVSVDGSTLAALSGPTCEGCKVTLDGVAALKNAGEHQTKPSISVQATNVLPGGSQDGMEVQVLTKDMAVDVVDKNGKTTSATEAGTTTYRIYVTWTGAGWIASDMAIDA